MDEVVQQAKSWIKDSCSGVELERINEEERIIFFKASTASFYITVPQRLGQEEWGVWSDEECVSVLCVEMDSLSLPANKIDTILDQIVALLANQVGMATTEGEEEDEEEDYDYYGDDDDNVDNVPPETKSSDRVSATEFFTGEGSPGAVHRLLSDLKSLNQSSSKYGIAGHPLQDNLFLWTVELSNFPPQSFLEKDLLSYSTLTGRKPVITMEMTFPKDYPMNPPFVRILWPRFKFLTGHVTVGGSICMQMLTRSGWSPSNDIESILIQIRAEIMSDPKARLELMGKTLEYNEHEAKMAFERMVMKYGWDK